MSSTISILEVSIFTGEVPQSYPAIVLLIKVKVDSGVPGKFWESTRVEFNCSLFTYYFTVQPSFLDYNYMLDSCF